MAVKKALDLNTIERPTLLLTLTDDAKTAIRVTVPNTALIKELASMAPHLKEIAEDPTEEAVDVIYDLAARLISCNRDFRKVSAEDLRGPLCMDLESLILFFAAYTDFVGEITNAKN